MAMTKKTIFKAVAVCVTIGIIFVLGVYFYITSDSFIRNSVLPRISEQIGHDIAVKDIRFSLFNNLELKNVNISKGSKTIAKIDIFRVKYDLMSIIKGNIIIDECLLENVTANIEMNSDDFAQKAKKEKQTTKLDESTKSDESINAPNTSTPEFKIQNIKLKNINIKYTQKDSDGKQLILNIKIDADLPKIANGEEFNLKFNASGNYQELTTTLKNISKASFQDLKVIISGKFNEKFIPEKMNINTNLNNISAIENTNKIVVKSLALKMSTEGFNDKFIPKNLNIMTHINDISISKDSSNIAIKSVSLKTSIGSFNNKFIPENMNTIIKVNDISATEDKTNIAIQSLLLKANAAIFGDTFLSQKMNLEVNVNGISGVGDGIPIKVNSLSLKTGATTTAEKITVNFFQLLAAADSAKNVIDINIKDPIDYKFNASDTLNGKQTAFLKINRFNTALIQPFLPANKSFVLHKGFISSNLKLTITNQTMIKVFGKLVLENADFTLNDTKLDNRNINIGIDTTFRNSRFLDINKLTFRVNNSIENDLNFLFKGSIDLQMTDEDSKIEITSLDHMDILKLEKLFSSKKQKKKAKEKNIRKEISTPRKQTKRTSRDKLIVQRNVPRHTDQLLKMQAFLKIPSASYKNIRMTEFALKSNISRGILTINESSFKINNSKINFTGEYDITDKNAPAFNAEISSEAINLEPFIQAFDPKNIGKIRGSLALKECIISGKGFEEENLQDMKALIHLDMQNIVFKNFVKGISRSIFKAINLVISFNPNKLKFAKGEGKLTLVNNKLDIEKILFSGADQVFELKGNVLMTGKWPADITIDGKFGAGKIVSTLEKTPLLGSLLKEITNPLTKAENGLVKIDAFNYKGNFKDENNKNIIENYTEHIRNAIKSIKSAPKNLLNNILQKNKNDKRKLEDKLKDEGLKKIFDLFK